MKFAIVVLALVSAVLAADTTDARNEFDHLLIQTALSQMTTLEYRLLGLQREIAHLETNKSKAEQERIIAEIEYLIGQAEHGERLLKRELARSDLNILEQYDFESAVKISEILVKNLKEAEVKVKAVKTN